MRRSPLGGLALWTLVLSRLPSLAHAQQATAPVVTTTEYPNSEKSQGDSTLGERIAGGVVFDGKLWLRGTVGPGNGASAGLVSLNLSNDLREVHFTRGVIDIERVGQDLLVMRWPASDAREVVLSIWNKGRFDNFARFSTSSKEMPIALLSGVSGPIVLSTRAIRMFSQDKHEWHKIDLKAKLRGGFQETAASPLRGNSIYVGFNTGEWGGGLQRIDLQTGAVSDIERRDTKELCAGPLNSDCDPVTGVIPDAHNKDCVFAAVGLVHMMSSHGSILRVCGEDVSVVFEKSYTVDGFNNAKWKMAEAFFGLIAAADEGFWAISSEAFYRFGVDGTKKDEYALPKLKSISGIYLSRELPGVIVVRTDANWAVSVSGYTPLVIPLQELSSRDEVTH